MKTQNKSIRIENELLAQIEKHLQKQGESFNTFVKNAIIKSLREVNEINIDLFNVYNQISNLIQKIENIRDYKPDNFNTEMLTTLDLLYKCWELLRQSPQFYECEID